MRIIFRDNKIFGIICRLGHSGWHHYHTIVVGHFLIGGIDIRLIAAGMGNTGFQIIRRYYLRAATIILQCPAMGADLGVKIQGQAGLYIGITAGPQDCYKYVGRQLFAGGWVRHGHGETGIINKHNLPGFV